MLLSWSSRGAALFCERKRAMKINRRDFLRSAAGASGALLLGRAAWPALHAFGVPRDVTLPPPSRSGIEHMAAQRGWPTGWPYLFGCGRLPA